jgi:hypothetical protein
LMVTMSQKSSLLQPANSVSQVLIPDNFGCVLVTSGPPALHCAN